MQNKPKRQHPHCTDTQSHVEPYPDGSARHRHPRRGRICVSRDEFRLHLVNRILHTGETVEQADRHLSRTMHPVRKGKRVGDDMEEQRIKPRITPLEAQRRALAYMRGRSCHARGGDAGKQLRTHRGCDFATARSRVKAEYCVMGTWEDLQAYGDECSVHWAEWNF